MKDASQNALVAQKLLSEEQRNDFVAELNKKYDELRQAHQKNTNEVMPIEEARKKKLNLF
jgi:5-methyltetrahydrofolate--homocysteine methyltransferase